MKFILLTITQMTKFLLYGTLVQCLFFTLALADSFGQHRALETFRISLEEKNLTLGEVFDRLEQETDFNFTYVRSKVPLEEKVTTTLNGDLKSVLQNLANAHRLHVKRINDLIVVKKVAKRRKVEEFIIQNEKKISGVITDAESEGTLPGASILVKGTTIGTVTDMDGNFALSVPDEAETLIFSYVGYETQEITIGNKSYFEVALRADVGALDEVVVYGYGSGTKEKFNGAVSKVEAKEVNNYSTANFEQALVGNIAGVQILQNTKNPGESSTIQIRGISTLTAGTDPLLVVDGVPLTEGTSLSSINTRDIESINVLKDAASAAIYGSRAANGVILVTTKKGSTDGLSVTYDGYVGVNSKLENFELVDAYDAAIFHSDARNNGYVTRDPANRSATDDNLTRVANGANKRELIPTYLPAYLNNESGLTNTDWEDAVYRDALQQSHYLNLRGGSAKTNYSISLGYLGQENTVIDSDYERYTGNVQVNSQLANWLNYGVNFNTSVSNANITDDRAWADLPPDPGFAFSLMDPYYPVYNADGTLALALQLNDHNENWDGPIAENVVAHSRFVRNFERQFRLFGNTYLEIEPIKDLKIKTSLGGDYRTFFSDYFSPSFLGAYRTPVENNPAQANETNARNENFLIENTLKYAKGFGKHSFNLLLGQSYQQETFFRTFTEGTNFVDDNIENVAGANNFAVDSNRSKWSLSSLFSRLEYDYEGKYYLSAAVRRDGSSRFGANNRFATFSSFSAGWVISEEAFFPQTDLLDFAKVRVSWGQSGNNQIGDFSSQSLVRASNYTIDGQLVGGSATSTAPNANLSWETNISTNYGIDLGFFSNQILVTAEYYQSTTEDLLLNVPVPQQTGFSQSLQNVGKLENRGLELEVRGRGFQVGELEIGFNANLATNQNEVLALGEGQNQIIDNANGVDFLTRVGEPIAQFYAYDIIGVFKSEEELNAANDSGVKPLPGTMVGDYIVRDADGDGVITPDDRVTLGDYNPELTYGFGFNLAYRGFDIAAQFDGVIGREVYDRILRNAEAGEGFVIPSQYYFDNYYHPTRNPEGFFGAPNFANFSSARRATRSSNLSVLNADFFRMRSLQIGYTLPERIIEPVGISNLRVYFTGNNLFNLTDYRGLTSEAITSDILTRGINRTGTPMSRFLALGLTITL
ncbi:MAG: TonB-dependent receptor [Bacteroidota bacterium]